MKFAKILNFATGRPEADAEENQPKPPPRPSADAPVINPLKALGRELEGYGRDYATTANILTECQRDKDHVERYAFARTDDIYRLFCPETNFQDRQLIQRIERSLALGNEIEDDYTREATLRDRLEKELPTDPGAHSVSTVVIATAVLIYALGNGASVFPLFALEFEDDPILAWGISLVIGAAIGALIVWSLLGLEEEKEEKS